jgi:hypothetical protein
MRGRGVLIAAAVLQLVGGALGLFSGVVTAATAPSTPVPGALYTVAAVDAVIAAVIIPASIALLYRKRWGWYLSVAVIGLFCLTLLAMPLTGLLMRGGFGIGFGEMIIIGILTLPIFVTFGLLIGGRHAVFAPKPKTAAEPMVITPPVG